MTDKTPQQEYDEMFTALQTDDKYAAAMAYVMKQDFLSYMVTMFYLINCQRMMLKDFHLTVIKKLQGLVDGTNEKRNLALCLPVGCLSGDTKITARAIKGDYIFDTDFDIAILANTKFDNILVQSLDDNGNFIWQDCEVVKSGVQKVCKLKIVDTYEGTIHSIKATETHKFMLENGKWKELKELQKGDKVKTIYGQKEVLEIIKNVDECETFDIICPTYHNYIANGIVVHNSGKSLLTEYFISWCFARSRDNAFVYTSHSEDLITKMSAEIRSICTFPMWQRLFGWVLKKDDRQKTNFSFEGAKNRTGLRAKAINSAITGLDAGNPAVDGFSGALVCFPYDQKILTEKGAIKIGEIVENKMNVRVFSYNFAKQCIELQNIDNYITNPEDDIVKVTLKNGTSFECTKNHKVWTSNRGYIEAQDLISGVDKVIALSNPFNLVNRQACFIDDEISGVVSISDKIERFLWQFYFLSWFIVNFTCKSFKRFACLNGLNRTYTAVKCLGNFSIVSFISCYINYIFSGQIAARKYERTNFDSILHIFGLSTISKIFKAIIRRVRIKVSNFHTDRTFTDKSQQDELVDSKKSSFAIFKKLNNSISSAISTFKDSFRQKITTALTSFIFYPMFKSFDNSCIRNLIESFIVRDVFVDNVCFVRHDHNSFCLTVHYNHNMFVGNSQGILVKNCDDAMDAGNAIYEIERENVIRIYNEKLATRRRTPTTPTILIMQRLHPEDLVGWVEKNQPELWDIVKVKALNDDGTSFWEERYPASELEMLQKRQGALFQAQYQQEPVITGGSVIKTEWFKYYQQHPKYERIFMTSDTAMKANEWNDYSVLQLWGKYQNGLYLIDMIRGKWEVPDLIQKTRDFVKKYRLWENRILLSALYVEDRGSGVGLIQQLRRETSVPILPLKPNKKDKVTRAKEIAYYIESGMVFLPQDKDYSFNRELLTEIELFSGDGSAKHDDQCFDGSTLVATLRGDIPIKDVKKGDYVITPVGLKKVLDCGITGYRETIKKFGLEVTPDHKIFADGVFDRIDHLVYNCNIDRLTYGGLLKWMYQSILCSMESNTILWGREGIISVQQQQMLHEKILKDFMLRCGNFITDGKYLKVVLFTIKTITHLIMTSLIWSAYQLQNIMPSILKEEVSLEVLKNSLNIWKKSENLQKNGMQVKKDENGIGNILKRLWKRKNINKSVQSVDENMKLAVMEQSAKNAKINCFNENYEINDMEQSLEKSLKRSVLFVEQSLKQDTQDKNTVAKNVLRPVYNLTIEDVGCFYANGILVSNCDAMIYAVNVGLAGTGTSIFDS